MSLADEFEEALAALPLRKPEDAAIRALGRRYADDLDESPSISLEGAWVIELVEGLSGRQADVERVRRFVAKSDQLAVLAALGPKFQAVLDALEMTPKARSAVRLPTGGTNPAAGKGPGGEDEDDLSRQRRERATTRGRRP